MHYKHKHIHVHLVAISFVLTPVWVGCFNPICLTDGRSTYRITLKTEQDIHKRVYKRVQADKHPLVTYRAAGTSTIPKPTPAHDISALYHHKPILQIMRCTFNCHNISNYKRASRNRSFKKPRVRQSGQSNNPLR